MNTKDLARLAKRYDGRTQSLRVVERTFAEIYRFPSFRFSLCTRCNKRVYKMLPNSAHEPPAVMEVFLVNVFENEWAECTVKVANGVPRLHGCRYQNCVYFAG